MLSTVIVALVLCVLEITALVVASPMMKPAFLLGFLPEDVRLAAKDHPEPPKSKQILAYLIFAVFIIAMIGGIIFVGMDGVRSGCGFWKLTLRFLVVLYINKAFDILVQDRCISLPVYADSGDICAAVEFNIKNLFLIVKSCIWENHMYGSGSCRSYSTNEDMM